MTENNVIGPIGPNLWKTMRCLKGSIAHYRKQHDPKYDEAIEMESHLYKDYMEKALIKRAVR